MTGSSDQLSTDPAVIGPGIWRVIHILAKEATTPDRIRSFIYTIKIILDTFPCEKCRQHGQDFLQRNPIEKYLNFKDKSGNLIGIFRWSYDLHNNANKGLGKKEISWEEALRLYSENVICLNCSSSIADAASKQVTVEDVTTPVKDPVPVVDIEGFANLPEGIDVLPGMFVIERDSHGKPLDSPIVIRGGIPPPREYFLSRSDPRRGLPGSRIKFR